MKKLTGNQVRKLFLDYFAQQQHMIEPSASLVPYNDNTLLWINSGVAALKKYFDGTIKPKNNRISNAQKSIRTNDIENVGYTARHHTFFEMLGNFSIGDYFKKEAIHYAWEFLTSSNYIGFDKEKLYVTVHIDDEVAYDIWVNDIGVNPNKILKTEHNFWQIGEGPSGPNSEIFYDRGEKYDPEKLGEKLFFDELDNDRYIEVWNIVFSMYDAKEGVARKDFKELPQKNIDTGMGLERLTCIVQEVDTNFDTDLFMPIIRKCETFTTKKYENENLMAYRVIADHIRTLTFALADGAMFSNEGRGYVLRRILRRAVRFAKKLGIEKAFLFELVSQVNEIMGEFYPYILEKTPHIQKLIKQEEEKFHLTLHDGEKLLNEMIANAKAISGKDAFKLYDTYGFPFELTLEIANEHQITVDKAEFDEEMERQKQRARNSRQENASFGSQSKDLMAFTKESNFVGYETLQSHAEVIAIVLNGDLVESASDIVGLIFNETPFYATSGGQEFDKGSLLIDGISYPIQEVVKAPNKQHIHYVELPKVQIGDKVLLQVDKSKRDATSRHHSATHLLQLALKTFISKNIAQAGSFYNEEYLRFDFTHFEKINDENLLAIENFINDAIKQDYTTEIEYMALEDAKKTGANALFDEKYGDIVRVVTIGDSKELCGGTHVKSSGAIQQFKLLSEESVGSGVRRITAITGDKVVQLYKENTNKLSEIQAMVQAQNIDQITIKIKNLQDELQQLKKLNEQLNSKLANNLVNDLITNATRKNDVVYIVEALEDVNVDQMKNMVDAIKSKVEHYFVFFVSRLADKLMFVAACSDHVAKVHSAGNIVKEVAQLCGGNGGGKPTLATAGGKDISKVNEVITIVKNKIGE